MELSFVTWNVRFVCMSWSLKTVVTELVEYRLGSVGVQEVGWDNGGIERAEGRASVFGNRNKYKARNMTYCTLQEHISSYEGSVC